MFSLHHTLSNWVVFIPTLQGRSVAEVAARQKDHGSWECHLLDETMTECMDRGLRPALQM